MESLLLTGGEYSDSGSRSRLFSTGRLQSRIIADWTRSEILGSAGVCLFPGSAECRWKASVACVLVSSLALLLFETYLDPVLRRFPLVR